ncbi:MAG: hypothetical protein CO002_04845 [Candidatus Portnoybacteria bacterium CG_4_8_14_3_um_filter_44_10]|uniref:Uncharacterized protein n=3 Tax=Candidatus Portnoyibacteriota TaxID=1817913 RepID=A0A2H0KP31_9BACT|nr:MAG: hypothetical protein COV85_05015 [Candidatus Portnoybacteria bacterium CG11_big_fil_rev_8_21_14_0_20_44_10]PIW74931.1 MAG: hypothetical protein CO002_04845 [Candidatus Portnoybacteria bacterium CG_4_8_14_3_um_filter_44_10]PIZ69002.1 MAG: hypothetical protein COY11_05185 [Candidatus Portnoybacteria bacterium CG_4_10_14_0_2_um_filter_44_20]
MEAQNNFITKKYLDKKLEEQAQILVAAVDNVLIKRLGAAKDELRRDINNVQILIDSYVKAQEDFKQEFVIMKEEVKRIKDVLREKLGVEIRAI